eukprot:COSAG02_NODE_287_length_25647_cov_245.259316_7_plen_104_part_00
MGGLWGGGLGDESEIVQLGGGWEKWQPIAAPAALAVEGGGRGWGGWGLEGGGRVGSGWRGCGWWGEEEWWWWVEGEGSGEGGCSQGDVVACWPVRPGAPLSLG